MLRVLLLVNGMLAAVTMAQSRPFMPSVWFVSFLESAAAVEPMLIASLAVLCPVRRLLRRTGYAGGWIAIAAIELFLVLAVRALPPARGPLTLNGIAHDWIVTLVVTATVLYYFNLRGKAFSPALSEARLQALQARIRPHFLFNSLTAVLSLIRTEPRRAEAALEDLADLFRVLLRENRKLVRLDEEIDLCRRYLDIEVLRLGQRLQVEWRIDDSALDSAMPPLILQPLVENAVHHGIEPSCGSGLVSIGVARRGPQVEIEIVNPKAEGNTQPADARGVVRVGNHMALENVRERLALHFDVEARLETRSSPGQYRVRIVLPYRRYVDRAAANPT